MSLLLSRRLQSALFGFELRGELGA